MADLIKLEAKEEDYRTYIEIDHTSSSISMLTSAGPHGEVE
jgi:hypothetical protein